METTNGAAKQLFRDLFRAFNDREWTALGELLDEGVVVHDGGEDRHGPESVMELLQDFTTVYPDAQIAVEELFAADERVAARVEIIGTSADSSSEETVSLSGVTHGRIEDGRIAEIWLFTAS